jgi:hypothetical protein
MSEVKYPSWAVNLERQAGIRRGIILHGEILDVRDAEANGQYTSLLEVVQHVLKRKKFKDVIVWDRFKGVEGESQRAWDDLRRPTVPAIQGSGGVPYAMGQATAGQPTQGKRPASVEDALSIIHDRLVKPSGDSIAFILDWSNYLFGNANALSELERQWLLILGRALRDAPINLIDIEGMKSPGDLIVFMSPKSGSLPPALFQNNPSVAEILIPMPDRTEREAFFSVHIDRWNVKNMTGATASLLNDCIDATDGMTIRDLQQMVRLSRQEAGEKPTFEQLLNLYKYGDRKSPWEDLSRDKLSGIKSKLCERVKGQEGAVDKVANVIIRAFTGLSGLQHSKKQRMPKGTLFFVGPTGVGKTELAKAIAAFLFGDEEACIRFDMSEFNHEHSDQRLVGAPPGYVGYEEGGQLTNAVKRRPFSVLLFDEIEKAHVRILDKFLQILEDGRLTDGRGETVYFSETVIIFTSNIGAAEVQASTPPEVVKDEFIRRVREHFVEARRPELLNRIGDNIVPFNFIVDENFLIQIARGKLAPLRERLKEKYGITQMVFDKDEDKALRALVAGVDRQMGGRGVLNEIVKHIIDPLSTFLFEDQEDFSHYAGRTLRIIQVGDTASYVFRIE